VHGSHTHAADILDYSRQIRVREKRCVEKARQRSSLSTCGQLSYSEVANHCSDPTSTWCDQSSIRCSSGLTCQFAEQSLRAPPSEAWTEFPQAVDATASARDLQQCRLPLD
jgi:hypothetical protein